MNDYAEVIQLVKAQDDVTNFEYDDPQIPYFINAWKYICPLLGKDFEQHLSIVMRFLLKVLSFERGLVAITDEDADLEESANWKTLRIDSRV